MNIPKLLNAFSYSELVEIHAKARDALKLWEHARAINRAMGPGEATHVCCMIERGERVRAINHIRDTYNAPLRVAARCVEIWETGE